MNMTLVKISLVAIAAVTVLLAWFFLDRGFVPMPNRANESATSTTGQTGTSTQAKKELPPEPDFVLPEGAMPIDEYAFGYEGKTYFKSLTNDKEGLPVPNADPNSFKRFANFATYPGKDVVRDCGAAPLFAFYVDEQRPYFYQIWRAPEFRSSAVDAMVGVNADTFEIQSPTSVSDGDTDLDITYQVGTSTCRLMLEEAR
ncbi:hypothetical protein C4568_01915 [Candidatus Parcubacteria bacterium]|nr:MAG: hypothetical protein C4568_01915 [Candidatus Parcubacteria bacterium]